MKRLLLLTGAFLAVAVMAMGSGEKEEAAPKETIVVEEGRGDEIDPWILEVREPYMRFIGDILPSFRGPTGQKVTWSKDSLVLTRSEAAKIKNGTYKVAICWHILAGDYIAAWRQGILDACDYFNLEVVAETDAGYDPGKQASDVETVIPLKPDVIISVPIEPVTSAAAFRPALEAGIKISFVSNQPDGYVHGRDYIGITTANCHDRGLVAADLVGDMVGRNAKVALITWGVDYWFTKYSDDLVRETLAQKFPGITVLADEQFIEWEKAGDVAAAVLQRYPEVEGFYTTYVSSALPIASACVDAGRPDIKVITNDIDEPTLINMVVEGNIVGAGEDMTYNIGVDAVIQACYGILGKEGPEYAVGPIMAVTRENVRDAWGLTKRIPIPEGLAQTLEGAGL